MGVVNNDSVSMSSDIHVGTTLIALKHMSIDYRNKITTLNKNHEYSCMGEVTKS